MLVEADLKIMVEDEVNLRIMAEDGSCIAWCDG